MITFDPGAPDSEPLERIATALEGIRRELGLLRDSVEYLARTATRPPQLGPPRCTPPPPAPRRR